MCTQVLFHVWASNAPSLETLSILRSNSSGITFGSTLPSGYL